MIIFLACLPQRTTTQCLLIIECLVFFVITGCGAANPPLEEPSQSGGSTGEMGSSVPVDLSEGEKVYSSKCELCHDKGELGAPRLGNPSQWTDRVAQGEDMLTQHAFEGFEGKRGEMPPQGDDLTMDEVRIAVRYMVYAFRQAESIDAKDPPTETH